MRAKEPIKRKMPRLTDRKALLERASGKRFPIGSGQPKLSPKQKMRMMWTRAIMESIRKKGPEKTVFVKQLGAQALKRLDFGIGFLQDYFNPRELIEIGFTKEDFLSRGCGFQAHNYRMAGVTAKELAERLKFTAQNLRDRYFGETEIQKAFKQ